MEILRDIAMKKKNVVRQRMMEVDVICINMSCNRCAIRCKKKGGAIRQGSSFINVALTYKMVVN